MDCLFNWEREMEGGINTRFPAGVLVYCIGPALWRWSIPFSEQRESSWCASPSLPSWRPTQASLALEACPEGEMLNTLAVKGSLTSHLLVSRCNEKMRCQLLLCCVDEGGTSVSVAVGVGLGFCGFDGQSAQQQVVKAHSSYTLALRS